MKMARWFVAVLLAGSCAPSSAGATGVLPEGIWVLNKSLSVELVPGDQALWIVKDDGVTLVWVNVARSPDGEVRISSYSGKYGGDAAPVQGSPMTSGIVSPGPGLLHNFGKIEGMGDYSEDCQLLAEGKRLVCHGEVATSAGKKRWVDDFDWIGPSPDLLARK